MDSEMDAGGVKLRRLLGETGASEAEVEKIDEMGAAWMTCNPRDYGGALAVSRYLTERGFTGSDVAQMLSSCRGLMLANATTVDNLECAVTFLTDTLKLKKGELRKVARAQPDLLLVPAKFPVYDTGACPAILATANCDTPDDVMQDIVELLRSVGVRDKYVREMVVKWPQLLSIPLPQMLAVSVYLSTVLGDNLGKLYRLAPWIFAASVSDQLRPAINFLDHCGVIDKLKVVRAYPRCLITNPDDMGRVVDALLMYGVRRDELGQLVESFPLIFGLDINETMEPAVRMWRQEIGIDDADIARICRSFPSLLGVHVETMRESLDFLREIGVHNTARFVTRLPPVLAYDVESVLKPKMAYAVKCGLSVYDIVRFPAYFSYPLDSSIKPRAEFLQRLGVNPCSFGLNRLLTKSDVGFARDVGADPDVYRRFKDHLLAPEDPPPPPPTKTKSPPIERTRDDRDPSPDGDSPHFPRMHSLPR